MTIAAAALILFAGWSTLALFLGCLWLRAWFIKRRLIQLRLTYYARQKFEPRTRDSARLAAGWTCAVYGPRVEKPHPVSFSA